VEGLEHFDIQVVGERRVAPDTEHGDSALYDIELRDHFDGRADGDGLTAARAQMMLAHVDEQRGEIVDQPRWRV
jgi:hypothetical protein